MESNLKKDHSRIQSPSSIILFNQCPRKYYYRYILKLPSIKSIHLVRGSIIHKVLEDFFDLDLSMIDEKDFFYSLKIILLELFFKEWSNNSKELSSLDLAPELLNNYFEESKEMIINFYYYLKEKMTPLLNKYSPIVALKLVKPEREVFFESRTHQVRGYIDAIQKTIDNKRVVIDYKTSKKLEITNDYKLQLGIYSLLMDEKNLRPDKAGIFFLKYGRELLIDVSDDLINNARNECLKIQIRTRTNNINDYPMNPSPLCDWGKGRCEFYDLCYNNLSPEEYRLNIKK